MKIRCKLCGTVIEGDKKGNCIDCGCGNCYIDETPYYTRVGGNPEDIEVIDEIGGTQKLSTKINAEIEDTEVIEIEN